MKHNYSKLEGEEVVFKTYNGTTEILVVAGCDQSIGLTLHAKGDVKDNRICLTGPLSPVQKPKDSDEIRAYKAMFHHVVSSIRKGVIDYHKVVAVKNAAFKKEYEGCEGGLQCAFSQ